MDLTQDSLRRLERWSLYALSANTNSEERYISVIQHAYKPGIRTFMTADVYGNGAADEIMGRALTGLPRDSYCLVGAIGHDF